MIHQKSAIIIEQLEQFEAKHFSNSLQPCLYQDFPMQTRSKPSDVGILKIFLNRKVANLASCTQEEKKINTLFHVLYILQTLWRNFLSKLRHIPLQEYFEIETERKAG